MTRYFTKSFAFQSNFNQIVEVFFYISTLENNIFSTFFPLFHHHHYDRYTTEILVCLSGLLFIVVMFTMSTFPSRPVKRHHHEDSMTVSTIDSTSTNFPQLTNYVEHPLKKRCQRSSCDWSLTHRKKIKRTSEKKATDQKEKEEEEDEQQYHCHVYLKLFPSTLKCSIEVIVKSIQNPNKEIVDEDSILIGKTRIPKTIRSGVIRIRLVSTLFSADVDVSEDPSLIKLETIRNQSKSNHFNKEFALVLKNDRLGPGVIGKLFLESLDPSNGSYTNNPPVFELNLQLASKHEILLTSSDEKVNKNSISSPLTCGCLLSNEISSSMISDQCNFPLSNMKLIHRLAEPLRCHWKSIGRELSSCFSEIDLTDFHQRYFFIDGNQECTYQLLREWSIREPHQANIRHLLTRLKLPFDLIVTLHNDIVQKFSS